MPSWDTLETEPGAREHWIARSGFDARAYGGMRPVVPVKSRHNAWPYPRDRQHVDVDQRATSSNLDPILGQIAQGVTQPEWLHDEHKTKVAP